MTIQEIDKQIAELTAQREVLKYYQPTYCGVGYLGEDFDKETDANLKSRWSNMIQRCYNPNAINYNYYGGDGVTVSENWLNFSNFKKWWQNNYYDIGSEKLVVDKDVLIPNNKLYDSETCLILPVSFNSIFTGITKEYKNNTRKLPVGVYKQDNGHYQLTVFNTTFSNFISLDEAVQCRAEMYQTLLKYMVNNYPTMPDKVKNAILNYDFYATT